MTIKEMVLDDSILDLDSWLPKEAVEQIVQIISNQKKHPNNKKNELLLNTMILI